MTKRVFVSIEIPKEIKDYLQLIQNPQIRWIKWMKPDNFHITINFLGDLNEKEIELAKQVLAQTAVFHAPFSLLIKRTKAERDMLWLLPEDEPRLDALHGDLAEKFREAGIGKREKRRYMPHVLLAKSKPRGGKPGRYMTWHPEQFERQEFSVHALDLYESQLTPDSATHILIQSFALG